MSMPTNRPFFANFFSAFRARTNPTFQAKSSGNVSSAGIISPTSLVSAAHVSTTTANVTSSNPRTITTKAGPSDSNTSHQNNQQPHHTTSSSASSISSPTRPTSTAPLPLPFSPTNPSHTRYAPPLSRTPLSSSPNTTTYNSPPSHQYPTSNTPRGRQRRGSDSSNSSGGFVDALAPAEKWYIGGRSGGGEETFYRLGLVSGGAGKRVRSLDRLSL